MRIRLQVKAIEDMGESSKGRSAKVTLSGKAEGTIYDHSVFIHLPWDQAQGIALGDEFRLTSGDQTLRHIDAEVERAQASVDRVLG